MKHFIEFIKKLINEVIKDELFSLANELTYKILLSMFPFVIFLMTILGFLNIDGNILIYELTDYLPYEVLNIFITFVDEVIDHKNATLLSTSLLVSIFSASSGFKAVMRGINKSYGLKETRNIISVNLISIALMLVFAVTIVISLATLIFGDSIFSFLSKHFYITSFATRIYGGITFFIVLFFLLFVIMLIYKVSCCNKITFKQTLPGAAITVTLWLIASKIFNIYVNNFSKYSKVYGSIGSLFILLIWLNIIAVILLIGSEVNALFETDLYNKNEDN